MPDKPATERSAHTPGPWKACRDGECQCRQVWSIPGDAPVFTALDTHGVVALVGQAHQRWGDGPDLVYGEIPEDQTQANALLVSAAPDLLAVCKAVVAECSGVLAQHAQAAIDKAEPPSHD